jgi:SH3-like domain-containing protein
MFGQSHAAPVGSQTVVPQTVMARGPAIPIPTRQVTTIQANVRSAPSTSGPVVRTFVRGQVVQALQTEDGWTRVAEQDGEPIGWMHNSVLK